LLEKILEHYSIAHLRENPKPVQPLASFINMATGPGYYGAVKANHLRAQHVKQFPCLKVPAEFGTCTILESHEHILAKMLEQVTIDGYFRRKCDVIAHLIDWEENERQTKVVKIHFVKLFGAVVQGMDGKIAWPLMILEAFKIVFERMTPAMYRAADWRYWSLAWLLIVEHIPTRYQKGEEREVDVDNVAHLFRMGEDDTKALPRSKVAGRVKPKNPELFAQMMAAMTAPKEAFKPDDGEMETLHHRGIKTIRDSVGKLHAVKKSDDADKPDDAK
jgi:hypothetical protein